MILGRTTKAIHLQTGVAVSLINKLSKEYESNATWFADKEIEIIRQKDNERRLDRIIDEVATEKRPFFSVGMIRDRAADLPPKSKSVTLIRRKLHKE